MQAFLFLAKPPLDLNTHHIIPQYTIWRHSEAANLDVRVSNIFSIIDLSRERWNESNSQGVRVSVSKNMLSSDVLIEISRLMRLSSLKLKNKRELCTMHMISFSILYSRYLI